MGANLKHEISAGDRSTPISATAVDWPLKTLDIDRKVANPFFLFNTKSSLAFMVDPIVPKGQLSSTSSITLTASLKGRPIVSNFLIANFVAKKMLICNPGRLQL